MARVGAVHLPPVVPPHRVARTVEEVGRQALRVGIVGTGLEEQHLSLRPFRRPRREDRTGGASAYDDGVCMHCG